MAKRRRAIVLALAAGALLLAFGPALLTLGNDHPRAQATAPGAPAYMPRLITPQPSAPALSPGPTPTRTPAPSLAACEVSAGRVFLRAAPRRASRALDVLAQGQRLTILSTPTPAGARWLPVQAGALAGWVNVDFCLPLEATP